MHIYIFDYFLKQRKYDKIVAKIETRLTDLGLNGKNCHVGPLKSLKSIIGEELRNNPKTIIAVGNNGTLNQVINAIEYSNVIIGIIPVGGNNSIAHTFGIEDEDQACNVLSARLIETIDLGQINDQYFISHAQISNKETIMEIKGKYTIEPTGPGKIDIINLETNKDNKKSNPKDGLLEIFITVTQKGIISSNMDRSFIQTNRIIINNLVHENFIIDDSIEIKTPVEVGVERERLPVIVGKDRKF